MPDSVQGLAVLALALLPGAIYIWSFEREVGQWGLGAADRVFRFVGVSALFQVFFVPAFFWIWSTQFFTHRSLPLDAALYELIVVHGKWWVFLLPATYLTVPMFAGLFAAIAVRRDRRGAGRSWAAIARVLAGRDPTPRAWDYLFGARPSGLVRLELTTGERLGGIFGPASYASGYFEEPQDLYLEMGLLVDQESGEFLLDDNDSFEELGYGVLVRWENVKVLEFSEGEYSHEDKES